MRKFIGVFFVSIFSFNVLAAEDTTPTQTTYWYSSDWNIDGIATTEYIDIETKIRGLYKAEIAKDKNKRPRIYFSFHYRNNKKVCNDVNELMTTMEVEGQLINMSVWCNKYNDSENTYMEFTPKTTKGINFVVNKFKKLKEVKVGFGDFGWVNISAKGFSREWNNHANIL